MMIRTGAAKSGLGLRSRLGRVGISLLALTAAASAFASSPAFAADPAGAEQVQQKVFDFRIAAKPLLAALADFTALTGVQVVYPSSQAIQGASGTVDGRMTVAEALAKLLASSGLTSRFTASGTVIIERQVAGDGLTLAPVSVEGASGRTESATGPVSGYVATRSASADKTDTPILETAQSVSVVTADQIADRQVNRVQDAVAYTSGVRIGEAGFDPRFDEIYVRGLEATISGDYLDGLRQPNSGWLSYYGTEPYGLERIEVLKGPASVMYGQISPGGMVNRVTKRPSEDAVNEVEVQMGNNDLYQGQFDVGGKASADGSLLYRLVGVDRDARTTIHQIDNDTRYLAPSFLWQPNADTSLTVLTGYQYRRTAGSPMLYQTDSGVLTNFWPGDEAFDKLEQTQYTAGYELEHKLDAQWTLRQKLRYGHVETTNQYLDVTGVTDGHILDRSTEGVYETMQSVEADNQAQVTFATGDVKHTLLSGIDAMWMGADVKYALGSAPSIDMLAPDYNQAIATPDDITSDQTNSSVMYGLYSQDQMIIDQWRLTLGLRHDILYARTNDNLAGTKTKSDEGATSGKAGVLYLFDSGIAPYVSLSTSFSPQAGTDKEGNMFKSSKGRQGEVGVKYQPPGSKAMLTASLFDLTQTNVLTKDPSDSSYQVQTGEEESKGAELEAVADVTENLRLTAAYSFTKAEVTKSNDGNVGKRPVSVPEHLASLWGDYTLNKGEFSGLGFGGGVRWVGSSYADEMNTEKNSDYGLVDAVVHYDLAGKFEGVRLALNASNLFDYRYVTCESGYCYKGEGRSVIGSVRYRW